MSAGRVHIISIFALAFVTLSLLLADFRERREGNTSLEEKSQASSKSSESYKQWLKNVETEKPLRSHKSIERFHMVKTDIAKNHEDKGRLQQLAGKSTMTFAPGYPVGKHIRGYLDVAAELDPSDDATVPAVVIPNQILAQSASEKTNPQTQSFPAESQAEASEDPGYCCR